VRNWLSSNLLRFLLSFSSFRTEETRIFCFRFWHFKDFRNRPSFYFHCPFPLWLYRNFSKSL